MGLMSFCGVLMVRGSEVLKEVKVRFIAGEFTGDSGVVKMLDGI